MICYEKIGLPPIYKRNGEDCYLDPIRKKLIYITPEETVRQRTITYLVKELKVPEYVIDVEQHLSHYGQQTKKRADIVVHAMNEDNLKYPLAVIECKAPEVYLDDKAIEQMLAYCDIIGADYAMLTNGVEQFYYKYDEDSNMYLLLKEFPNYRQMLAGIFREYEPAAPRPRVPFEELQSFLQNEFDTYDAEEYGSQISKLTPMRLAVPMFNLLEGLMDCDVKMPTGDYGLFQLIQDFGCRFMSYGNGSGGKYGGYYRSFLVDVNGSTEFYSIGFSSYSTYAHPDDVKTCICVAHDDEKESHHALQLAVEDNLIVHGNHIDFYHHGKIAIGRQGSGKISELRMFVEDRYPQIISGNKFYLGSLVNDRLWRLDDPEVIQVIVNLISYAMVRDEYRDFVKKNSKK